MQHLLLGDWIKNNDPERKTAIEKIVKSGPLHLTNSMSFSSLLITFSYFLFFKNN